jgi:D-alanyl-D-alanine carboxypeptidase
LLAGCSDGATTDPDPEPTESGLNTTRLDSLFFHFAPEYNYTDEPTHMLGHASQVSVSGLDTWTATLGIVDTVGSDSVRVNSVFRIGSITKVFTATIILQLWEEGLVDLDSSFNHYLELDPETYPKISEFKDVTLRHLLSHRSGLPYISSTTFFDVHDYTDSIAQPERVRFLFSEGEPEFEPGAQYAYRNSNFNVLGLIIEHVCERQYHEVLQQRIYSPLGLENTHLLDFDMARDDP